MPATPLRRTPFIAVLILLTPFGLARGQDEPDEEDVPALFNRAENCRSCHKDPNDNRFTWSRSFLTLDQYDTWLNKDKHAQAFAILRGKRGQRMGEVLGRDVTKEGACLSCHALDPARWPKDAVTPAVLAEGVTCEACHGASGPWLTRHWQPDGIWRKGKRAEKWAKAGMIDVYNPRAQAEMCLSCHVGSPKEGKVLTHEMYAAGHPPLPSIEIATFGEAEPRHWSLFVAKKDPKLVAQFGIKAPMFERTRIAAVGGVVALKVAMDLLAHQARSEKRKSYSETAWPEFAHFECYSCHHELARPGWRQIRGYDHALVGKFLPGKPGRPQIRPWPLATVKAALRLVERDDSSYQQAFSALNEKLARLYRVADARPFGDPKEIVGAAEALARWANDLLPKVESATYDATAAARVLRELAEVPDPEYPDYDSARQVAWMFQAIYGEVDPNPPKGGPGRGPFQGLDKTLKLDPYATRDQRPKGKLPGPASLLGLERLSEDELAGSLRVVADYDPRTFKKELTSLRALVPPVGAERVARVGAR